MSSVRDKYGVNHVCRRVLYYAGVPYVTTRCGHIEPTRPEEPKWGWATLSTCLLCTGRPAGRAP